MTRAAYLLSLLCVAAFTPACGPAPAEQCQCPTLIPVEVTVRNLGTTGRIVDLTVIGDGDSWAQTVTMPSDGALFMGTVLSVEDGSEFTLAANDITVQTDRKFSSLKSQAAGEKVKCTVVLDGDSAPAIGCEVVSPMPQQVGAMLPCDPESGCPGEEDDGPGDPPPAPNSAVMAIHIVSQSSFPQWFTLTGSAGLYGQPSRSTLNEGPYRLDNGLAGPTYRLTGLLGDRFNFTVDAWVSDPQVHSGRGYGITAVSPSMDCVVNLTDASPPNGVTITCS